MEFRVLNQIQNNGFNNIFFKGNSKQNFNIFKNYFFFNLDSNFNLKE